MCQLRSRLEENRKGRVPFALVGVVILMLSVASISVLIEHDSKMAIDNAKESIFDTLGILETESSILETKAYYILHEVLSERMDVPLSEDTKNLEQIDELVRSKMEVFVKQNYPVSRGIYDINVIDWDVRIFVEQMKMKDFLQTANITVPGPKNIIDNTSMNELNTYNAPLLDLSYRASYLRITGLACFNIQNNDELKMFNQTRTFNKIVYSPIPLLNNLAASFQCDGHGELSSMGRMVKYMTTTLAQYRVLCGFGGGGYGGRMENRGISDIIKVEDVETAVNLALLLFQTRYFRDYDEISASLQRDSSNEYSNIDRLMERYVHNGSIDPADLISVFNDFENESIDAGKIAAQSAYSFSDRFIWELLDLIWGSEWGEYGGWDGDTYFDPVLEEPIISWKDIEEKDNTEEWCRDRIWQWLGVIGKWLGATDTSDENGNIISIRTQEEENPLIKDIYARYRHPAQAGEGVGQPSGADLCNVPTPPPGYGSPNYYLSGNDAYHVDGRYYLFGDAADSTSTNHRWYVKSYIRDEESDPNDTTDIRYLMLGEDPGVNGGDDQRPYTYKMVCRDDWNSGVGERTYEYYMVKESLIEKHGDYQDDEEPYYSTFRFIIDALNRSIKQQSHDINNTDAKGMMDYASFDIQNEIGVIDNIFQIDPEDEKRLLEHQAYRAFGAEGDDVFEELLRIEDFAEQEMENWFQEGAFINHTDDPDSTGEYFLFDIIRESVDLWYETIVNIYDGGYRDFDEDGASIYDENDGPDHWPNFNGALNSDLPILQYQSSQKENDGGSNELAGSFKYRNDALRDCYNRVMQIVQSRDDSFEFNFNNWEDLGSQHWQWSAKGVCGEAGILYGWVYAGSGTVAVPLQDQNQIPRECFDGTGTFEDLTPYDDGWKETGETYPEGIWDIIKIGNSERTNLANNDGEDGIYPAISNIVGSDNWPKTTNYGILDDVKYDNLNNVETTTDEGKYGATGQNYDFQCDFYEFVKERFGMIYLDDDGLWEKLTKNDGWIMEIISDITLKEINENLDLFNMPIASVSSYHRPWNMWDGNYSDEKKNGSIHSEKFVVDQIPDVLENNKESLIIKISQPEFGRHMIDVQNIEYGMYKECFSTSWKLNLSGNVSFKIRNSIPSLVTIYGHKYFWYNFSMDFDLDTPIVVYSGWNLESAWKSNDIKYKMTRHYFDKHLNDTPEEPFFISREWSDTIHGFNDIQDWIRDTNTLVHYYSPLCINNGGDVRSKIIANLTNCMNNLIDPSDENEGLLEKANDDNDFMGNISDNTQMLKEKMVRYSFEYYGYSSEYYPNEVRFRMINGNISSEKGGSGMIFEMSMEDDIQVKGKIRSNLTTSLSFDMSTLNSGSYKYDGSISLDNNILEGRKYNFSIQTNSIKREYSSEDMTIEHFPIENLGIESKVKIGILSSATIPEKLQEAIKNSKIHFINECRNETLLKQSEEHIHYFLGELYNNHRVHFKDADLLGLYVNLTYIQEGVENFINKTYGLNLSNTYDEEADLFIKQYIRHLINNTDNILQEIGDTHINPVILSSIPESIADRYNEYIYRNIGPYPYYWFGTISDIADSSPFIGSQFNFGNKYFKGGRIIRGSSDELYNIQFSWNMGT